MNFDAPNSNQVKDHVVHPSACRVLWQAVLEEQLRVALRPKLSDSKLEVARARDWFGSKDFHIVCELAGFDGSAVMARLAGKLQKARAA